MRLSVLLVSLFQAVWMKATEPSVSAYVGESVTLPSGADQTLEIVELEWAIYDNITWIVTFDSSETKTNLFYLYKDRLSYDKKTGNLTIKDLREKDTLTYTAYITYKNGGSERRVVPLEVKNRLQIPTIDKVSSAPTEEGCFVVLTCSSSEDGVTFSWSEIPPAFKFFNNSDQGKLYVFVHTKAKQDLRFTCTSSKNGEKSLRSFSGDCEAIPEDLPQTKERCSFYFSMALVVMLTFVMVAFLICYIRTRKGCSFERRNHH